MTENATHETPLESWKEIAAFLKRDERTARRWEKEEGLPVHRHHHLSRASVYAYPSELEAWRAGRSPEPAATGWWRPVPAFASTVTIALALLMAGSGPHIGTTVQAADGIVTRQIWTGPESYHAAISPDGRYLAFADYWKRDGDLAVRDLETQTVVYLTEEAKGGRGEAGRIIFSPDGNRIAYGWYRSNFLEELRLVERDRSSVRVLIRGDGRHSISLRDWSPDGTKLLGLRVLANPPRLEDRNNAIVAISIDDGSLQVLKTLGQRSPLGMAFSPDGRYIAYDLRPGPPGSKHDIFLLAADGSAERVLVTHPGMDYVASWEPGGKYLFFVSDRTGDWSLWRLPVADGRASGPVELVKRHTGRLAGMDFATDGSLCYRIQSRTTDVYGAELDTVSANVTGAPKPVVERFMGSNANPVWSPDGKYLAYYSRRGAVPATPALCIRDEETGKERDLNPRLGWFQGLSWFHDGRSLLAYGEGSGTMAYFRIDATTGDVTKLLDIDFRGLVPWAVLSPDGNRLYNLGPAGLAEHDLVSGRGRTIAQAPEGTGFVLLAISPDGKFLATQLNGRGKKPNSLAVLRVDTGEIREVTTIPPPNWFQNIAWTPDGRHLLFTKHFAAGGSESEKVELCRVAVDSGEEQDLGLSLQGIRDLSIHPDGRRIAFTVMRDVTEIWIMENLLPGSEAAGQ